MATSGETDGPPRTLHIRFRESDDAGLEDALETLDSDGTPEAFFEITFHDPTDVHRVTRPKNLELLRAIVRHDPSSIRETARIVDRDVSQVHRNLSELETLHLIDLVEDDQSKRPEVWYDAIELDLPLRAGERSAATA